MTKYGPDMTKAICDQLAMGMTRTDSCEIAGICYDTFCEWMKQPEFSEAIKSAELRCKSRNIGLIQAAASGQVPFTRPNAFWAAWWLERKHPQEFAPRMAHMNPDGSPLNLHAAAVLIINQLKAAQSHDRSLPDGTHTDTTASVTSR